LERLATTAGFLEVFEVFDVFKFLDPGRPAVADAARKRELEGVCDVAFAPDLALAVLVADALCAAEWFEGAEFDADRLAAVFLETAAETVVPDGFDAACL
jgi:hypothetical protein